MVTEIEAHVILRSRKKRRFAVKACFSRFHRGAKCTLRREVGCIDFLREENLLIRVGGKDLRAELKTLSE